MLSIQNYFIRVNVLFRLIFKIASYCTVALKSFSMHTKRETTLTSIPERNENEDEPTKWVPKKRHEVLKAKYKCLKKLFQIYDENVIGVLPGAYSDIVENTEDYEPERRKKRSRRTKTDASTKTADASCGSISVKSDTCTSTNTNDTNNGDVRKCASTINQTVTTDSSFTTVEQSKQTGPAYRHPVPYLYYNEKPRRTKFQCFIHRLFGIRYRYKPFVLPNGHIFAASDNNIVNNCGSKRRRRGIRFRRRKQTAKKVQSEYAIRGTKQPSILNYVQTVQRSCLLDTTPRQCPIVGCGMIFYGIINYNDHLNLCHFKDRKYSCHYCHEGFETEQEKLLHENEHLGLPKLNIAPTNLSSSHSSKKVIKTQTESHILPMDLPEEKLKKIVSFFDKIVDSDGSMCKNVRKEAISESNLRMNCEMSSNDSTETSVISRNKTFTCRSGHGFHRSKSSSTRNTQFTDETAVKCHICGETFDHRRQLSLHVDLEHRVHNKFSKFHSCAGIVNSVVKKKVDCVSEDGTLRVESLEDSVSTLTQNTRSSVKEKESENTVSYDPSTNIVYYDTSMESVTKENSVINNLVKKVKSGIKGCNYKWEPGTKVIRV